MIKLVFNQNDFADNLREKRLALNQTQVELAESSGVSQQLISKYEACDCTPTLANVARLASALGCTPNDLVGWPN